MFFGLSQNTTQAGIVMIGAGWWGQGWHLPDLHKNPRAKLLAIVEPCQTPTSTLQKNMLTVSELEKQYGCPVFATLDEVLSSELKGSIDGVVIAVPHAFHYELGMKAIKAGLNVFMEKPMTTDVAEARLLAAAVAEAQKVFMVNHTASWRPQAQQAQAWVRDGKVGAIRHASVLFAAPLSWLFDNAENKGWNEPSGTMTGNGFGWGQLSHPLGWLYQVTGLTPGEVFAFVKSSEATPADMFEAVSILCTNGATVSISGVASLPGKGKRIDFRIYGSEGMIQYGGNDEVPSSGALELTRFDTDTDGKDLRQGTEGSREVFKGGFLFENGTQGGTGPESLQAFLSGCLGEAFYEGTGAEEGLKAVATIDAVYRSAASKRAEPVHLTDPPMCSIS